MGLNTEGCGLQADQLVNQSYYEWLKRTYITEKRAGYLSNKHQSSSLFSLAVLVSVCSWSFFFNRLLSLGAHWLSIVHTRVEGWPLVSSSKCTIVKQSGAWNLSIVERLYKLQDPWGISSLNVIHVVSIVDQSYYTIPFLLGVERSPIWYYYYRWHSISGWAYDHFVPPLPSYRRC